MRAYEFIEEYSDLEETASGGATGAGAIASVPNAMGSVIKRMPTTPNLFGYIPAPKRKNKKKSKSKR